MAFLAEFIEHKEIKFEKEAEHQGSAIFDHASRGIVCQWQVLNQRVEADAECVLIKFPTTEHIFCGFRTHSCWGHASKRQPTLVDEESVFLLRKSDSHACIDDGNVIFTATGLLECTGEFELLRKGDDCGDADKIDDDDDGCWIEKVEVFEVGEERRKKSD